MPAGVFADRYLFLPSVGFCWLIGWVASQARRAARAEPAGWWQPLVARGVPAALALLAVLYGARTVRRNRDWRSEDSLYLQTLAEQPDAQLIRTNLGVLYWSRGDEAGAEREWIAALGPRRPYAPTLNNLGLLRTHQKRYNEAIDFFHRATQERPYFMEAYKNLAAAYLEMGRTADAERELRQAVALAPLSPDARNAYGHFLRDQGRAAEAREQFAASAQADDNAEAEENLGDLLGQSGDAPRARAAYRAAIAIDAYDHTAQFGLAALDEHDGHTADAIREYRAGLNTDPMNAGALAAVRRLATVGGSR
jgi:Tfp pilus assembly protein PilF